MNDTRTNSWYLPFRSLKMRRDATRVCAGYFDKRSQLDSYPPPSVIEQREQNVLGSLPNGSSNDLLSADSLPAAPTAMPPGHNGQLTSAGDDTPGASSSAPKLPLDQVTSSSVPVTSTPAPSSKKKTGSSSSHKKKSGSGDRKKGVTAPKTQSNLRHMMINSSSPSPDDNLTPLISSIKRPAAFDDSIGGPPVKKARAAGSVSSTTTSDTLAIGLDYYDDDEKDDNFTAMGKPRGSSVTSASLSPPPSSPHAPIKSQPQSRSNRVVARRTKSGRVKYDKGWKGWVVADGNAIDESRLIKIDQPLVLPGTRQTRSGKTFAEKVPEEWEHQPSWA